MSSSGAQQCRRTSDAVKIKESFRQKANKGGSISQSELRRLLLEGKPDFPLHLLNGLIAHLSKDKDGMLSFDDVVDVLFDDTAGKTQVFNVGQHVECRGEDGAWERGVVTSSDPLKVCPQGWKYSLEFAEVRALPQDNGTRSEQQQRQTGAKSPLSVFIVCDPGPDPDDCKVLIVCGYLERQGIIKLEGVIANGGHQARERAKLAKAVLRASGLPQVRVGVGTPGKPYDPFPHEYSMKGYDDVTDADLEDGHSLFMDVLQKAAPKSLLVQGQSGFTDIANAMKTESKLFLEKVVLVSIQAGLDARTDSASHRHGWAVDTSANIKFDPEAGQSLVDFCFDHGLKLHAVGRLAVPELPMALANRFRGSGSKALEYLAVAQECGLLGLWKRVCTGGYLPERCDKEWFFCSFCGVDSATFKEKFSDFDIDSDIAEQLNGCVRPYDLVAFMTLLPITAHAFDFHRAEVVVNGSKHYLFVKEENAASGDVMKQFLAGAFEDVVKLDAASAGEVAKRQKLV